MFPILLLLFIFVPIIEVSLFIQVGHVFGLWPTISLVLFTAVVGASLVRSQGLQTLTSVQSRLAQGELPAQEIFEGVMLAVAGVLLLTPGFMTDTLGIVVLLPIPRRIIAKYLMTKIKFQSMGGGFSQGPFQGGPFGGQPNHGADAGDIFEGEFERKDENHHDQNRLN